MALEDDRKRRIMEHLARSKGEFNSRSTAASGDRKQRIMDHIRKTKG